MGALQPSSLYVQLANNDSLLCQKQTKINTKCQEIMQSFLMQWIKGDCSHFYYFASSNQSK